MLSFNPDANRTVYKLYINNNTLIMTGAFNTISRISRPYVAAWDLKNNTLSPWKPNSNTSLYCSSSFENRIALDDFVTQLSYLPHGYGAIIECPVELYTPTATATRTWTRTYTRTFTPTRTNTPTHTRTRTQTPTQSMTSTRTITAT